MRARTWIATTAVSALAATTALVGVAAVGPANAAVTTQPAGVSVTVDSTGSNTAFVSSAVVANLTVRDNAASATIGAFTAVVPAGVVGPVKVVGVDHGWGYTTLPCAGTAENWRCSWADTVWGEFAHVASWRLVKPASLAYGIG